MADVQQKSTPDRHQDMSPTTNSMSELAIEAKPAGKPTLKSVTDQMHEDIARQIDYYFSAENLTDDRFLYKLMKQGQNRPVPLGVICSWNKMRAYKRDTVIKACERSSMVDLVEDLGEHYLKRKEPFILIDQETGKPKKKSKKSKPKPTGFERFYADAPVTPDQYALDQENYDPNIALTTRIETALQHYAQKRRFHAMPLAIFNRWMRYGGVNAGQKMFSGKVDKDMLEGKTNAEIAAITTTSYVDVGEDKFDGSAGAKWDVDFEGVAKGFLSSEVPEAFDFETQTEVAECTNILRNFYNSLLHHDVCPEYRVEILAARRVCDTAEHELLPTHKALRLLPGKFNVAVSTLFGGSFASAYGDDASWLDDEDGKIEASGPTHAAASNIFKFGVAALGADDDFDDDNNEAIQRRVLDQRIVNIEENLGLEVVELVDPQDDHIDFHASKLGLGKGQALGKIVCKRYQFPTFDYYDLPPGHKQVIPDMTKTYTIWLEEEVLDQCFVGMKIDATVGTLSGGLQFFDRVNTVRCSFYTLLENDLMLATKWKEPRVITREEAMQKQMEKEEWLKSLETLSEAGEAGTEDGGVTQKSLGMPKPDIEFVNVDVGGGRTDEVTAEKPDDVDELVAEDVD